MKVAKCPFCWGENIRFVDDVKVEGSNRIKPLMECHDCEKFYWDDDGKEIKHLSSLCQTKKLKRDKCNKEFKYPLDSRSSTLPSQKIKELNQFCSNCPKRQYLLNEKRYKFGGEDKFSRAG